jgi:tetratricopeptide (TPR) repeat protein
MLMMATKIGRNDPCHCGSGKKYKRCCLEDDQQNEREARTAFTAALAAEQADEDDEFYEWSDRLDEESNAVIDLIEAGKLDEAEQAAHQLIADYPEVHDGYDRLGMVYEARNEPKKAADCYRKVVEFLAENPSDDEREMIDDFQRLVQELDPPTSPDPPT